MRIRCEGKPRWLAKECTRLAGDARLLRVLKSNSALIAYDRDYQGIPNYHPGEWKKTKVEYAGEIVVDVQKCECEVNNGSGTYKPDPPGTFLREVERLFAKLLGVRPIEIRTFDGVEVESLDDDDLQEYPQTFC